MRGGVAQEVTAAASGATIASALVAALAVVAGSQFGEAFGLFLLLTPVWVVASAWWSRTGSNIPLSECVVVGLVVSSLATLAVIPLARMVRIQLSPTMVLAALSVFASVPLLLGPRRQRATRDNTAMWRGAVGVLCSVLIAVLWLAGFWANTPLSGSGRWRYFTDVPYFEAMGHGLARFGSGDSPFVVGNPTRYHWLVYGWQGLIHEEIGARPFVVQTRVLPIVAAVGAGLAALALARRWSAGPIGRLLAPLLVVASTAFFRFGVGPHLPEIAPSQSVSVAWLLVAILVLFRLIEGSLYRRFGLPFLFLLSFAVTGAKVTHGAVLLGGALAILFVGLRRQSTLGVSAALVSVFGVAMSTYLILWGGNGNGFGLGVGSSVEIPLILVPLLLLLRVVTWGSRWLGIVGLVDTSGTNGVLKPFLFGVGLAGLIGFVFTEQNDGSYTYFALSASVILSVASAVGTGSILGALHQTDRGVALAISGLVSLSAFVLLRFDATIADLVPALPVGSPRQLLNVGAATAILVLTLVLLAVFRRTMSDQSASIPGIIAVILVTSSVATFALLSVDRAVERLVGEEETIESAASFWSESHDAGAAFLRSTAARTDVVLTNRMCESILDVPPTCGGVRRGRYFWVGALSERRMYAEGYEFALGYENFPDWLVDRVERSLRFASEPNLVDQRELWEVGVRWVWMDLTQPSATDWTGFGSVVFENDAVRIVQLAPPSV